MTESSSVSSSLARFSTSDVPDARRVELWEGYNTAALIGLRCRTLGAGSLAATEVNLQLDRIRLAGVTGTSHVVGALRGCHPPRRPSSAEVLDTVCAVTRVEPGLRPPSAEAGAEAPRGAPTAAAGAEVRLEGRCGVGEVLGGEECAGREAAGANSGRVWCRCCVVG